MRIGNTSYSPYTWNLRFTWACIAHLVKKIKITTGCIIYCRNVTFWSPRSLTQYTCIRHWVKIKSSYYHNATHKMSYTTAFSFLLYRFSVIFPLQYISNIRPQGLRNHWPWCLIHTKHESIYYNYYVSRPFFTFSLLQSMLIFGPQNCDTKDPRVFICIR